METSNDTTLTKEAGETLQIWLDNITNESIFYKELCATVESGKPVNMEQMRQITAYDPRYANPELRNAYTTLRKRHDTPLELRIAAIIDHYAFLFLTWKVEFIINTKNCALLTTAVNAHRNRMAEKYGLPNNQSSDTTSITKQETITMPKHTQIAVTVPTTAHATIAAFDTVYGVPVASMSEADLHAAIVRVAADLKALTDLGTKTASKRICAQIASLKKARTRIIQTLDALPEDTDA